MFFQDERHPRRQRSLRAGWMLALSISMSLPSPAAEPAADPAELPRLAPSEPEAARAGIRVRAGFRLDLAAAEPQVTDPVAMAFDEAGRLYVVEMRGYSERREDRLGQIRLLEDRDGDGRFEAATVFASGLAWPTAVACWDGGVFVGVTPDILYLKDVSGDGVADVSRVVFTGFAKDASRLNVQALLNSFHWGLDNRIHGSASFSGGTITRVETHPPANANSNSGADGGADGGGKGAGRASAPVTLRGRDFSFDPRTLDFRAESGGGQHGMSFDSAGRKYVCSNSRHLMQVMFEDRYAGLNPHFVMPAPALDIAADGPSAEVFRISPDEPWRIVRTRWRVAGLVSGPVEGGGRVSGYFTAATGVTVYRGDAFPPSWVGDLFFGDAGSNLIHHKNLRRESRGVAMRGERPPDEAGAEFAASADIWFRPVQFAHGPDGCLYVADMYREVIEHPWSLPEPIKRHLDLNSGNDRGRIYRIAPEGHAPVGKRVLIGADTGRLVAALEHPNGWHRDTAARLLYAGQDARAVEPLQRLAANSERPEGRVHALYALSGLGRLEDAVLRRALKDEDAVVRRHAVRLAESVLASGTSLAEGLGGEWAKLADDSDAEVRFQWALSAGVVRSPDRFESLLNLAVRDHDDVWIRAAVLNALGDEDQGWAVRLAERLIAEELRSTSSARRDLLGPVARMIGSRNRPAEWVSLADTLNRTTDLALAGIVLRDLNAGLRSAGGSLDSRMGSDRLPELVRLARRAVLDPAEVESARLTAVRVLGLGQGAGGNAFLAELLGPEHPDWLRLAVIRELLDGADGMAFDLVLRRMRELTPRLQREAVAAMLDSRGQTIRLLDGIRSRHADAGWVGSDQAARLRSHRDVEIRERAVALFGPAPAVETMAADAETALGLTGDPVRGRAIYLERCASCHRADNQGHALGPDLETLKQAGAEKIMVNILEPNREVAPNYVLYDVSVRGGETVSGILVGETGSGLTVRQANGVETVLLRSNVAGMRSTGASAMPEGLAEGLGAQGLADLTAFILRLGEP